MKGFSLIELMVVIAIVALLSSISAVTYQNYKRKVIITNALAEFEPYKKKIEMYFNRTGQFPGAWSGEVIGIGANADDCWNSIGVAACTQGLLNPSPNISSIWVGQSTTNATGPFQDVAFMLTGDAALGDQIWRSMYFRAQVDSDTGIISWTCNNNSGNANLPIDANLLPAGCS